MDRLQESYDEIVNVPVPRRYLPSVYRVLAEEMQGKVVNEPSTPEVEQGSTKKLPDIPWTEGDMERLRRMIKTPSPSVALDLTTERPGERVTLGEIAEKAGRTHFQARADLGGFTQLIRRQFGRDNWPFKVEGGQGGIAQYYCESPEVVRSWQSGRGVSIDLNPA